MIKKIIFILKNSINFQNFKMIKINSKIIIKYPSKLKLLSFFFQIISSQIGRVFFQKSPHMTIISGSPPYTPSCPLSIIKTKIFLRPCVWLLRSLVFGCEKKGWKILKSWVLCFKLENEQGCLQSGECMCFG